LLIVNVASKCGFTVQYEGLNNLYREFAPKGFSVLGFPCNQFGAQEPGDENEIKSFCDINFKIQFPMFSKIDVNGDKEHPLYTWLKTEAPGFLGTKSIKWNFTKFLIDAKGNVVSRFAPTDKPEDLARSIAKLLS
jgi:glutathione peroxidase